MLWFNGVQLPGHIKVRLWSFQGQIGIKTWFVLLLSIWNWCVEQESIKNDFCSHFLSRVAYHLDKHLNGFWGIFSPVGLNTTCYSFYHTLFPMLE